MSLFRLLNVATDKKQVNTGSLVDKTLQNLSYWTNRILSSGYHITMTFIITYIFQQIPKLGLQFRIRLSSQGPFVGTLKSQAA